MTEEAWWGAPGSAGALEVESTGARAWLRPDAFDTECFGIPMAKVEAAAGARSAAVGLFAACARVAGEQGWVRLAARVPSEQTDLVRALEGARFYWVDATVIFGRHLVDTTGPGEVPIGLALGEDLQVLQALGRGAFRQSRYFVDPCLDPAGKDRLTDQWVANALNGRADRVFVAEPKNPVGFAAWTAGAGWRRSISSRSRRTAEAAGSGGAWWRPFAAITSRSPNVWRSAPSWRTPRRFASTKPPAAASCAPMSRCIGLRRS